GPRARRDVAHGARTPRGGTRPRDRGACRRLLRPARGRGRALRLTHARTAPRGPDPAARGRPRPAARPRLRPRPRPHPRGCRGEPRCVGTRMARPAPPRRDLPRGRGPVRAGGGRRPPPHLPRARVRARARRGLLPDAARGAPRVLPVLRTVPRRLEPLRADPRGARDTVGRGRRGDPRVVARSRGGANPLTQPTGRASGSTSSPRTMRPTVSTSS